MAENGFSDFAQMQAPSPCRAPPTCTNSSQNHNNQRLRCTTSATLPKASTATGPHAKPEARRQQGRRLRMPSGA
ncbi:MAG: hypothetical protein RSC66_11195, partial [Comamonas sp.]